MPEPGKKPLPHAFLRGSFVSMSVTLVFICMALGWAGYFWRVVATFIPAFFLVNFGLALHYESEGFDTGRYVYGAILVFLLDVVAAAPLVFLLFLFTAAGGQ